LPEYPCGQRQLNPGLVFSQTALGPHGLLNISHSLISKHNQPFGKTKISKPTLQVEINTMTSFHWVACVVFFTRTDETPNGIRANSIVSTRRMLTFIDVYREHIDSIIKMFGININKEKKKMQYRQV